MEAEFERLPNSHFQALAWVGRADARSTAAARAARESLRRLWGEDAWRTYSERPDIRVLLTSLREVGLR